MTDTDNCDRQVVRDGYERHAATYASMRSASTRELDILDEFLRSCEVPARVLDAGCGQGRPVLGRLSDRFTAVGLDFSREQLRLATDAAPSAALVEGDLVALPFRDGVFDVVVAAHSIIHVPLDDYQTVLDEFARVLRPEGRLLLTEALEERRRTSSDWLDSDDEMAWEMAGMETTRRQLRHAGFDSEWEVPDQSEREKPEAPFVAAQLTD
ncbi:class I SAM-dependent methyltransferase [Halogranum rubrum]|uniref:Methyltransferase type 11 n=1 Tax=Halogranum salarium B-1 TaxID=1210908 RepID=J3JH30_9EURY|nr:class I SAM-dependent methyltransferase [Halogranum salarium]EJN60631.1 methyltransferase type 11 [Halogranum salarium B-1]